MKSINSPYAGHDGTTLRALDEHVIPGIDNDPLLTVSGAIYPTISVRGRAPVDNGVDVEAYDPLEDSRVQITLSPRDVIWLIELLSDNCPAVVVEAA